MPGGASQGVLARLGIGVAQRIGVQNSTRPDPWWIRYANPVLVAVCIMWTCAIYVWRVCYPMIAQKESALGSKREGIGLLVGFLVPWVMLSWCFATVVASHPGYVRDLVTEAAAAKTLDIETSCVVAAPASATMPIDIERQPGAADHNEITPFSSDNADSVRNTRLFSPIEEREQRWRELELSLDMSPMDPEAPVSHDKSHSVPLSHVTPPSMVQSSLLTDDESPGRSLTVPLNSSPLQGSAIIAPYSGENQSPAPRRPPDTKPPADLNPSLNLQGNAYLHTTGQATSVPQAWTYDPSSQRMPPSATHVAPAPAFDTRLPEPHRIPPDVPLYDPAQLFCTQCQSARPPRAHHCRKCGTCVLRMDHHCPWIGGCVGAHNYHLYFMTVLWGLILSTYVIVSMAPLFSRGVLSQGSSSSWRDAIHHWSVDGFMISVFAISFFFFLFTGSLVSVHIHMSGHNLTSIEQRAINSLRTREGMVQRRYFSDAGQGGSLGRGPLAAFRRLRARQRMRKAWNHEWGHPLREGNPWWIGSIAEFEYSVSSPSACERERELEKKLGLTRSDAHAQTPQIYGACALATPMTTSRLLRQRQQHQQPVPSFWFVRPPYLLNMQLSLGPPYSWLFPISRRSHTGVHFALNPRYSQDGLWRPRSQWPSITTTSPSRT